MRVRELTPGQEIDQVLMVRAAEPRKLVLGDRTGTLEAAPQPDVAPGLCVRVSGRVEGRGAASSVPVRSPRTSLRGSAERTIRT